MSMIRMLHLTSSVYEGAEYWVNPHQIVQIYRYKNDKVMLELSTGVTIYPDEDPEELILKIQEMTK